MTSSGRKKTPTFENAALTAGEHHIMQSYRALHRRHLGLEQSSVASDRGVVPQKQHKTLPGNWVQPVLANLQNSKVKLALCIKSVKGEAVSNTVTRGQRGDPSLHFRNT